MTDLPASYVEVHRYDGAVLQHGRREQVVPCAIQPRDFAIVRDVHRYKFLSAPQIAELWWPGRDLWCAQRRLHKLFKAGLLDRFRPVARRGSFPWTYHVGELGHRMLREGGALPPTARFRPRMVYDFGHVLHELHLNAWVLALRRAAGKRFLEWEGERTIEPPRQTREQMRHSIRHVYGDWTVHGMRDERERPIYPDAVLELERKDGDGYNTYLIEFDRTRRVDKNFEKFRRYDTFLTWWWNRTPEALDLDPPYVIFVCQEEEQLRAFVRAADHELTGHHWHASVAPEEYRFIGRERILFCLEWHAHAGNFVARRVPEFPPDHRGREPNVRGVRFLTSA